MNYVDIDTPGPGAKVLTDNGERIWISSTRTRDFSGSIDLAIREKAALALAGLNPEADSAKAEFLEMVQKGSLQFPLLSSVRIHVRLKNRSASASSTSPSKAASPSKADSASQPDESQLQLLVVEACEQDMLQVPNYSVMQLLANIAECCPRTDGIVIAQLHQIQATSHYALQVDFGTHVRPCDKVLALIVSTKKRFRTRLARTPCLSQQQAY